MDDAEPAVTNNSKTHTDLPLWRRHNGGRISGCSADGSAEPNPTPAPHVSGWWSRCSSSMPQVGTRPSGSSRRGFASSNCPRLRGSQLVLRVTALEQMRPTPGSSPMPPRTRHSVDRRRPVVDDGPNRRSAYCPRPHRRVPERAPTDGLRASPYRRVRGTPSSAWAATPTQKEPRTSRRPPVRLSPEGACPAPYSGFRRRRRTGGRSVTRASPSAVPWRILMSRFLRQKRQRVEIDTVSGGPVDVVVHDDSVSCVGWVIWDRVVGARRASSRSPFESVRRSG